MKKPECDCFKDEGGQVRVNVIASETLIYLRELVNEFGMCGESHDYISMTIMTLIARLISGAIEGVPVSNEEDAARFEVLVDQLPAKLREMNRQLNARLHN